MRDVKLYSLTHSVVFPVVVDEILQPKSIIIIIIIIIRVI